jgi:hypothetical protein
VVVAVAQLSQQLLEFQEIDNQTPLIQLPFDSHPDAPVVPVQVFAFLVSDDEVGRRKPQTLYQLNPH